MENNQKKINDGLNAILYYQQLLNRKGMGAYIRIDKKDLTPEVIERINNFLINADYDIGVKSARAGTISKEKAPDNISEKFKANNYLAGHITNEYYKRKNTTMIM